MIRRARVAFVLLSSLLALPLLGTERASAQDKQAEQEIPPVNLKPTEISSLQRALREWYKADVEATAKLNEAHALSKAGKKKGRVAKLRREAAKLRKKARKLKKKFQDAFEKRAEPYGGLLNKVGDLVAIFDGCFPYGRQANGGIVKEKFIDRRQGLGYAVRYPKNYKPGKSWPLIYVLPPRDKADKKWMKAKTYLETAWPKTHPASFANYIVVVPMLPNDMDLSTKFDPATTNEEAEARENERRNWLLTVLGSPDGGVFNEFQINTDRVYFEATTKAVPFVLRLATLFPDRFGGLILKDPSTAELDDATMLENLNGTGVLILASKDDKAAEGLAAALKQAGQNVTSKEGKGDFPYSASCDDTTKWIEKTKRFLFKPKIVLTPSHDRFRKAFWVEIMEAEYFSQVALSDRPRLEVEADRKANKIHIKGRNVTKIRLLLNDLIVDLDRKLTLVLNGQIKEVQRNRSLPLISNAREGLVVVRNDPRYIFVADGIFELSAPKSEEKAGGESEEDASGKKDGEEQDK